MSGENGTMSHISVFFLFFLKASLTLFVRLYMWWAVFRSVTESPCPCQLRTQVLLGLREAKLSIVCQLNQSYYGRP